MVPGLVTVSVLLDKPRMLLDVKDHLKVGYFGMENVCVSSCDQRMNAIAPTGCRAKGRTSITVIDSETAPAQHL